MASPVDDDTGILVVRNMGVNAYQNQKAKNESDFLETWTCVHLATVTNIYHRYGAWKFATSIVI